MRNEALGWLGMPPVTASARCQARYQLKHTAFIELNQAAVVLNRVALDAALVRGAAYEVDLAIEHLACTSAGDLLVMDRNDPSYRMAATLLSDSSASS